MTISEARLLAFVDGELSAAEAAMIKELLESDRELRQREEPLIASRLPYRAAFDCQRLPDVPANLREQVQAWSAADETIPAHPPASRRRWPLLGAALAAAFAAGLWVPVPIRLNPDVHEDLPWVHAILHYQALFVRDAVVDPMDGEQARALLATFASDGGQSVSIPDLRSAGLSFRRVQRLAVGEVPMIHVEYLPDRGKPISLCVLAVRRGDMTVATRRVDGMGVSTWRRQGLEFVIIAELPSQEVNRLAQLVSSGELPVLHKPREG